MGQKCSELSCICTTIKSNEINSTKDGILCHFQFRMNRLSSHSSGFCSDKKNKKNKNKRKLDMPFLTVYCVRRHRFCALRGFRNTRYGPVFGNLFFLEVQRYVGLRRTAKTKCPPKSDEGSRPITWETARRSASFVVLPVTIHVAGREGICGDQTTLTHPWFRKHHRKAPKKKNGTKIKTEKKTESFA